MLALTIFTAASCQKRIAATLPTQPAEPVPLPPAGPSISLTADRTAIEEGANATLSWKTENATSVQISDLGNVEPNGEARVVPKTATTYTATARGPGGAATDSVRITVTSRPSDPAPPEPTRPTITLLEDFQRNIQDVYFDYDAAAIRSDQRARLAVLADWLREHPQTRIMIEGHCDERGNQEYNLGLGDLRASSVRSYLVDAGIARERLEIVSFGEERPVCREQDESCWARNRRAHFVLTTS
jgi:peptidoglycan-associated lipoprotein